LIHPSHIFLATPLFSFFLFLSFFHSHIFLFLYFFIYYFSLFSIPYSYFSLYFPSLDILFKDLNSSLSCMHTI
jgi:hypothetical protein